MLCFLLRARLPLTFLSAMHVTKSSESWFLSSTGGKHVNRIGIGFLRHLQYFSSSHVFHSVMSLYVTRRPKKITGHFCPVILFPFRHYSLTLPNKLFGCSVWKLAILFKFNAIYRNCFSDA